jgi:outer membrane receptor protein involved in Fe transport
MSYGYSIRRAVRLALFTGAASVATGLPAAAADQPASSAPEVVEEVVVTGSRIRVRDYDAISPVTTVSAEAIQATGQLSVEEVLNKLPQVVPGLTASSNNPANGTSTVDLRGIGTPRTLVLINGRRLTPSTQTGVVDLNNIPVRLIDRVEVVTGGASAVYGSDALAGVVNFIMKEDYQGFDLGIQHGQSAEDDGAQDQFDILLGGNLGEDRGNITAFASYFKRDSVLQSEREFTRVDRGQNGSATGNARLPNVALNPYPTVGAFTGGGSTSRDYAFNLNNNGGVREWNNTLPETSADGQGDRYNFSPVNFLLTPGERINIGAMGNLKLNDHVTAYMDLMYVDSRNANQLAPTPAVNVPFDPDSPLLSAQARALMDARPNPNAPGFLTRRMVEIGPRLQENKSKLEQADVGFRGDLPYKDWQFDVSYQFGRTEFINVTHNDVSRSKFAAALSNCPADYVKFVPGCVPVNAFGAGSITPEMANFIRLDFSDTTIFERQLVNASINGSLAELPAGPLGFAVGAEYRKDSSEFVPDLAKKQGDILGFNAAQPVAGEFDVTELFVESVVPLLKDLPAVKSLSLEAGLRYSDYSSVGEVTSYKAGLDWAPMSSLHVRGMYQRAVRAPSVFELFQAGDTGFPPVNDPCASTRANGTTRVVPADVAAFCQATWGINSATYTQTNGQVESLFYGNPNLSEETSDTLTFGFALAPEAIPNLHLSVDYYKIKVQDFVNTLEGGATGVVLACFASLDIDSDACFSRDLNAALVFRDGVGDLKTRVPVANLSALETDGVDLNVSYDVPLGFSSERFDDSLQVNLLVTWLGSYELDHIDYRGTIGAYNISGAFPEYKANLRLGYRIGPVNLSYNLEFLDAMDNQGNIPAFEDDSGYQGVTSTFFHDLSARWAIKDSLNLTLGVRNLTDEEPKFFDSPIDQNTDPATFDTLGRFYFGSLSVKF